MERYLDYRYIADTVVTSTGPSSYAWIFLFAFIEALFPLTLYWPGTMLLISIVVFGTHTSLAALVIVAWFGVLSGIFISWKMSDLLSGRSGLRPLNYEFAKGVGYYFEKYNWVSMIFLSFQPSFSSAAFAYIGFLGLDGKRSFAVCAGMTLLFISVYALLFERLFREFDQVKQSHSDIVVLLLVIVALYQFCRCIFSRGVSNSG